MTVDQYFFTEVYYVVDTVVDQLIKVRPKGPFNMRESMFAWARSDSAPV